MGWTQVELDKRRYDRGLSPVTQVPLTAGEAAARIEAFERIKAIVKDCRSYIRPALSNAFFAAIEYPVYAAAAMSRKILCDATESHRAYGEIQSLTRQYNELCGGKWRGLMNAAPRNLPVFEDVHAQLTGEDANVLTACHACDYSEASRDVRMIQMLGHSMKAVALPKDGMLTFHFRVEPDIDENHLSGNDYTLQVALIPTQPSDDGDLRFSASIDGHEPVVFNLKEPFRSERWKENVLRGQALRSLPIRLTSGSHTLTLRALDDRIVIDQWKLIKGKNNK
jgi:hypothetical protein